MIDASRFNLSAWDRREQTSNEQAITANEETVSTEERSETEEITAVMEQGDNAVPNEVKDPRSFSLQPLCEAYKLAGGVSPQQREMAVQARVVEAGLRDGEERVEAAAPLAESEEQSRPESLQDGFQRSSEVMMNSLRNSASYLQREGNLTLSAQNGIRLSSLQGTSITGSNTFISTATTILNSQVCANASESIINLCDFSLTRVNGSSTTHVEDTNQITSTNSINRATETSQTIANRMYSHGIDLNSSTGSTMISTAGEGGHTVHSSGNVSTFTDSSIVNLATQDITMGAGSPTSQGPNPAADGNFDVLNFIQDAASFVRITSGDNAAITSVTSGDNSVVARGNQLLTAANTYLSAAGTAAQVGGRQLMNGVMGTGGNPRSHVFHQGRMIIQGRMIGGFPSVDVDALMFPTVPPLPPKPSAYSIEDLQACIPKSYKKKGEKDGWLEKDGDDKALKAAEALGIDTESIRSNAGSVSTEGNSTSEVVPGETGTEQDIHTTNSELTESTPSSTSLSLGTSINQIIGATSAGGGPVNVYPDIYEDDKDNEEEEDDGETDVDEERLLDSILNAMGELSDTEEFIARDLYEQGYRGENRAGYIDGVFEALRESEFISDRATIISVMDRMDPYLTTHAMGPFMELGNITSVFLPHVGSVGQVINESFGINSINEIIDGIADITSFSGIAADALNSLGLGNISSISSLSDISSLINNEALSDLIRNTAISDLIAPIAGTNASSFIPLINQILSSGTSLSDLEIEDLVIRVARSEGIYDLLPSNFPSSITNSIQRLIQGGEINLSSDKVISIISSLSGNSMPLQILSSYKEVESIISNIGALTAIPQLLGLMQDNDVPILSRASLLLSCLDIFNRVNSVLGSFERIISQLGSIDLSSIPIDPSIFETLLNEIYEPTEEEQLEPTNNLSIPSSNEERVFITTSNEVIEGYLISINL